MTRTVCSCGHDEIGHVNRGPCMNSDCNCVLFEDPAVDTMESRRDQLWEQQHAQMVWTSVRLQADADVRRAQADLLVHSRWLIAGGVAVLVAVAGWVGSR